MGTDLATNVATFALALTRSN